MSRKPGTIIVISVLLILGSSILSRRTDREAKACRELLSQVKAAKSKLPNDSQPLEPLEQYTRDLRTLSLKEVPANVRQAFDQYIAALVHSGEVMRHHGDTNKAFDEWRDAEVRLGTAVSKYTTTAF